MPLSGQYAKDGEWMRRGLELAAEKINSDGGILGEKVELIVMDDAFDEELDRANYIKLVKELGVDYLFGPYGSGLLLDASRIAEESNRLIFCTMSGAKAVHKRGFRGIISTITESAYSSGVSAASFLKFLSLFDNWNENKEESKPETLALVCLDNAYGREIYDAVPGIASKFGFQVVYKVLFHEKVGLGGKWKEIKALKPDIFMHQGYFGDAVLVIRQFLSEELYSPYIFNSGTSCFPDWVDPNLGVGRKGNFMYGSTYWSPRYNEGDAEYLRKTYLRKYGEDPNWEVACGYSSLELLREAVKVSGSFDNGSILEALKKREVKTALTPVRISEDGANLTLEPTVAQAISNKLEIVWPLHLATSKPVHPMPLLS